MSDNPENKSSFETLLAEIGTLQKAMPPVMNEPNDNDDDNDPEKKKVDPSVNDGDADNKPPMMAKSFVLKDADGNEHEAIDGTEMLKSLEFSLAMHKDESASAMTGILALVKSQSEALASTQAMVKSLQERIVQMGGASSGRKTVLNVHEQINQLQKSMGVPGAQAVDQNQMTGQQFFAKANELFNAGKLSGKELATVDTALRSGMPLAKALDESLIQKIVS